MLTLKLLTFELLTFELLMNSQEYLWFILTPLFEYNFGYFCAVMEVIAESKTINVDLGT